jgi:hypothetical protein
VDRQHADAHRTEGVPALCHVGSEPCEREEVDALADRSNYDGTCHECGRDDLGFLCCAVCGTELARRPDEGERLCAVCAVEDTHENLRRILAGADATE